MALIEKYKDYEGYARSGGEAYSNYFEKISGDYVKEAINAQYEAGNTLTEDMDLVRATGIEMIAKDELEDPNHPLFREFVDWKNHPRHLAKAREFILADDVHYLVLKFRTSTLVPVQRLTVEDGSVLKADWNNHDRAFKNFNRCMRDELTWGGGPVTTCLGEVSND
jgi:hypothetical protein